MNMLALKKSFILHSPTQNYLIKKVLGHGAFGITYLASMNIRVQGTLGQIDTTIDVCIKEFFMPDFCARRDNGAVFNTTESQLAAYYGERFKREALNLSHLDHPNIVKILEVFDANDTHYYVMEYIDGVTLDDYTKQKSGIPEVEALGYIRTISTALSYMHSQKMLHLDVKPKNIMRRDSDGCVFLIDFGLSKQYNATGDAESSTTIGLGTPGYAPLEQSDGIDVKSFPVTIDIYSLGATLFKLLTSETPPKASDIINEGLPLNILINKNISQDTIALIENMMQPLKKDRPQKMSSVLLMLCNNDDETIYDEEITHRNNTVSLNQNLKNDNVLHKDKSIDNTDSHSKTFLKYFLIVVVSSIVISSAFFIMKGRDSENTTPIVPDSLTTNTNFTNTQQTLEFSDSYNNAFTFDGIVDANGNPLEGFAKYKDGRTYKGTFVNRLPDGEDGTMEQKNGDIYVGSFSKGFYLKGKYTSKSDGYYFVGTFKDGSPYNGVWYSSNGDIDSKIINGK